VPGTRGFWRGGAAAVDTCALAKQSPFVLRTRVVVGFTRCEQPHEPFLRLISNFLVYATLAHRVKKRNGSDGALFQMLAGSEKSALKNASRQCESIGERIDGAATMTGDP